MELEEEAMLLGGLFFGNGYSNGEEDVGVVNGVPTNWDGGE